MKSILLIFNWHPVVPPANPFIFSFSWSFIHSIRLSLIWKVNLLSETLWPYWAVLLFYNSSVPFHSYLSFNDLLTRIYESTHVVSSDQEGEISIGLSPAFFSSEFFKGYYNHCSNHCRFFWGKGTGIYDMGRTMQAKRKTLLANSDLLWSATTSSPSSKLPSSLG